MRKDRGQTTLSLALLVGGTAILVGVTLLSISLSLINSIVGFRAANQALAVAMSGADDAIIRMIRDSDFSSPGYSIPLNGLFADVTVVQNSGFATITSEAQVLSSYRRIRVITYIDPITGKLDVISREQLVI